jgi:membrane protein
MITGKNKPHPETSRGRFRHALASAGDTLRDAIRNYDANGDANQAAAIALYGILSIIPLFILSLLIVNSLFSSDPQIREKLIEGIRQIVPSFSGELFTQIGQIEGKKEVLGGVGIISLIWFSAMIFGSMEQALNVIIRSKVRRNYFISKLLAIAMIPMGWTIGVASVGISYAAAILTKQPILLLPGVVLFLPVLEGFLFRYLLPYLAAVIFFTIVYTVIPTGKVGLKSALIGSAIFSALMEIAKQFFTWYVANYTSYNEIFGSLETVVVLVIWVFYIALIFLFCAELISSYQRRDMILIERALLKSGKDRPRTEEQLLRKFGRFYGRDDYIFREGDTGKEIFYILNGRIRMEKNAGEVKKTLAEMGPGEYFGEMAALIDVPRNATARCLEECHIAVISGEMLQNVLGENGEVSLFMLREFSNRLRHAHTAMEEMTHAWIRLMTILYFLRTWPLSDDRDPTDELAKSTGRETAEIRDLFRELCRSGALTCADGRVTGFNRDAAYRLIDEQMTKA